MQMVSVQTVVASRSLGLLRRGLFRHGFQCAIEPLYESIRPRVVRRSPNWLDFQEPVYFRGSCDIKVCTLIREYLLWYPDAREERQQLLCDHIGIYGSQCDCLSVASHVVAVYYYTSCPSYCGAVAPQCPSLSVETARP